MVVRGVVYTQDLESNVMAIRLATGKVLWTHNYSSPNGGPDGVNVVGGTVYAATNRAAVALSAATGRQLWRRTLIGNDREGIDMAPGYNHGTVYVLTVPVNPTVGQYLGGAKSTLWALNARTGAPEWSWDEVQNLWGKPALNSGGGLWDPPSFHSAGNIYIGVANPGPIGQGPWPRGYPWGTSGRARTLYTDSVVKLSRRGKLLWYYQLTRTTFTTGTCNSPVLTDRPRTAVVIDGGKRRHPDRAQRADRQAGLEAPGRRAHRARERRAAHRARHADLTHPAAAKFTLEPGVFGGVESQLASNGSTTFAAVNNPRPPAYRPWRAESSQAFKAAIAKADTGEMVAVDEDTGKIEWDDKLPSSPYGAATITNN